MDTSILTDRNVTEGATMDTRYQFEVESFRWPPGREAEFETFDMELGEQEWEGEVSRTSRDYIMWVQRSLNQILGLRLAVDGIVGTYTRSAIRSFQQQKALTVDGIVGPQTEAALIRAGAGPLPGASTSTPAPYVPSPSPSSGSGSIHYGKGWGGSEGVADAAKGIAASMGVPVTSEKRDLAKTIEVGSSTKSDHYTGNTTAFATDFGVSGPRGDELARAIATKYGIPQSAIGTYNRYTIQVDDRRYSLQLLWKVEGHYDHVHLGIRLA
jgi:hypothetical protein